VWLAALRRLALLVLAVAGGTAVFGLVVGALGGYGTLRAIAVSFYLVGVALLVVGLFVTSRGPVRSRDGASMRYGTQVVRWATRAEQEETLNLSAVFVLLGLLLIAIGVVVDSGHRVL
jgi:hypothetical protein